MQNHLRIQNSWVKGLWLSVAWERERSSGEERDGSEEIRDKEVSKELHQILFGAFLREDERNSVTQ